MLAAVGDERVDLGFVAVENSIEGAVTVTVDNPAFETDLMIQREGRDGGADEPARPQRGGRGRRAPGALHPGGTAQCRAFLRQAAPGVAVATSSTAEAAQLVAGPEHDGHTAAIAPSVAAKVYGLDVLATDIEDHPDNATRFVVVARHGIQPPTGHDKTSVVIFQRTDRPGSLLTILQEFAAWSINLTKLESPTKKGLGHYCFLVDLEGPHRRRAGGRLPARPALEGRGREVPRLVSRGRRARPGPPSRGRGGLAVGERVGRAPAGRDPVIRRPVSRRG